MKSYIFIAALLLVSFGLKAQKFAAASKGIFSDAEKVKVVSIDSIDAVYTFNTSAAAEDDEPEVFYLIDDNGNEVELHPEDILSIEIARGDESKWFNENVTEEVDDDDDYIIVDVSETTESTPILYFETIEIDHKKGTPLKAASKFDYLLLQRVDSGDDNFIKVYVSPNIDEGGTEVAPLGQLKDGLARNRKDYIEFEEFYYVKVGDDPAIRISEDDYIEYAPYIFNKSREFRKKYSIPREMAEERTKKRKKSSRKDVGSSKTKASSLRYDEFSSHIVDFQKSYVVEEAARQKKIADREAARAAARGN